MPEFKDLHVEEGLFHREFVIKGEQDYIDLCNNLMVKYLEMEQDLKFIRKEYSRLIGYLSALETNEGYSIYYHRLIGSWSKEKYLEGVRKLKEANNKIILLKKKECLLKNYYHQLLKREKELIPMECENQRLKNKNKDLRQQLKFLQLKNRLLRIKLIKNKM
jgi:hypothetical protein